MTAPALTLAEAAGILRDAVKDDAYRATPLGTMVGRYIRWLRNEYGATPATVRDYEAILARMSLTLADRDPIEVSIEDLRDVIDLWSGRSARTRQKVTSVVRSFWAWMEEQGHIAISPATRIRRPRAERRVARVLPLDARPRLLRRRSTRGIGSACSACSSSACDATSSPASRSATAALHRSAACRTTSPGRRLPAVSDPSLRCRQGQRGPTAARAARLPEGSPQRPGGSPLVVPPGAGRCARRAGRHLRAEHAPGPPYLRDGAAPRRWHRRCLSCARARRPKHDARRLRAPRRLGPRGCYGDLRPLDRGPAGRANRSSRKIYMIWLARAEKWRRWESNPRPRSRKRWCLRAYPALWISPRGRHAGGVTRDQPPEDFPGLAEADRTG